ncbi:sensor domain-containing diguanylate cyclase [Dongshaea marina]|uniref:sensor domain-containing diguanylate cyclase n=1 Tax=Dongshaea marina TaxID=2047966 RepID=UPI000D3E2ACE|nr:diguanylate cyclase [Dongshaea marina]
MDWERDHHLRSILDQLYDGLYFVDRDRRITYWNRAAEQITGFSAQEVVGHRCQDNILVHVDASGCQLCLEKCPLAASMLDEESRQAEVFLHHKRGHRVAVQVRTTPLRDDKGEIIGGIELFSEVSATQSPQKRYQTLRHLELLDIATGLPQRTHLQAELQGMLTSFIHTSVPFAVLLIDLDHFDKFKNSYGSENAELALRTISHTLCGCCRPFDTVGRWSESQFLCLLPDCDSMTLTQIAEQICALIQKSRLHIEDETRSLTASIGGSITQVNESAESILLRVSHAMLNSKQKGRNQVTISTEAAGL